MSEAASSPADERSTGRPRAGRSPDRLVHAGKAGATNDAPTGDRPDDPALAALSETLAVVGDRWTLLVVAALLDGPRRFGELQAELHRIAPNVLSQRLRHLEQHGLLVARPYSRRPPRLAYELTAAGSDLAGALRLLAGWRARGTEGAAPRHAACGTAVEAHWWCPTCERPIEEREIDELHFA